MAQICRCHASREMLGLGVAARTTNFASCTPEIITSSAPASSIVRASWSSSNVASTAAPETPFFVKFTPPPDQQPRSMARWATCWRLWLPIVRIPSCSHRASAEDSIDACIAASTCMPEESSHAAG